MKPTDILTTEKSIGKNLDLRPGDIVRIYEITGDPKQKKAQVFEGIVLARKHRKEAGATITVRKIVDGIGVEKIFPLLSPTIQKIEIIKRTKSRRAKLYYLRNRSQKESVLKRKKDFTPSVFTYQEKKETTQETEKQEAEKKD